MDMMAGLAKTGWKPFFAVYSTFLQRAFDQVFQEVALQGLAVRLCLDRAGLVGGDGAVHHGFCDISILRIFPDAVLLAAMDEPSLRAALEFMREYDRGLSAVRYPREQRERALRERGVPAVRAGQGPPPPGARCARRGHPGVRRSWPSRRWTRSITSNGEYKINVYDARFAKPVDIELVADLLRRNIPC